MPYLGNTPSTSFATVVKDTFNGGSTAYTLSKVATTNSVSVFVENVRQEPTTAYAVSGTTLTFTATTPSGTGNIYVLHMNPTTTTTHPAAQNLTAVDGTFTGAFTSRGIDDNADATAITINSSENVGIKTTNPLSALHIKDNDGIMLEDDGTTNTSKIQTLNAGGLRFYTGDTSSQTSRMTIETDGDVSITDGNLVLDSGNGIDFSDTTNTSASNASATSELLDDYEEGTWTPVFADANSGGNTGSYSSGGSAGNRYIKVGNLVYITCELFDINTSGMTGGNVVFIRGLPFSGHSSGTYNVGAVHMNVVSHNANGAYYTFMDNSAYFRIYEQGGSGAGHNSVKVEDINSTNSDIVATLMYFSS